MPSYFDAPDDPETLAQVREAFIYSTGSRPSKETRPLKPGHGAPSCLHEAHVWLLSPPGLARDLILNRTSVFIGNHGNPESVPYLTELVKLEAVPMASNPEHGLRRYTRVTPIFLMAHLAGEKALGGLLESYRAAAEKKSPATNGSKTIQTPRICPTGSPNCSLPITRMVTRNRFKC